MAPSQSVPPMMLRLGMPEQRTHDYVGDDLTTLFAVFEVAARTLKLSRPASGSGSKSGTKDLYSAPSRICRSNPARTDDVPVGRNAPSDLPERGCPYSDVARRRTKQACAALRACSEYAYPPTAQLPPQTIPPGPPESLDTVFGR